MAAYSLDLPARELRAHEIRATLGASFTLVPHEIRATLARLSHLYLMKSALAVVGFGSWPHEGGQSFAVVCG